MKGKVIDRYEVESGREEKRYGQRKIIEKSLFALFASFVFSEGASEKNAITKLL